MDKLFSDGHIHDGHRGRMRAKLLRHGRYPFDTYELLEMLLYNTIPYKDTNPIAKRLLYKFGSLDSVLSADAQELMTVLGVGASTAAYISDVNELLVVLGSEIIPEPEKYNNYDAVGAFLAEHLSGEQESCVTVLMFDNSMRLIDIRDFKNAVYGSAAMKPKLFIDLAIRSRASVVITAHNKFFGTVVPTPADRETVCMIASTLRDIDVLYADHYIVSNGQYLGIAGVKPRGFCQHKEIEKFFESKAESAADVGVAERQQLNDDNYNSRDLNFFADLIKPAAGSDDAVDIAKRLLIKYQTVENILSADSEELLGLVSESMTALIKLLAHVTSRRVTERFTFGKSYSDYEMAEFIKALFIGISVEQVYLISLDGNGRLVGCDLVGEGSVNASGVTPRRMLEAAIRVSAERVYMAHNHPFGMPKPSSEDIVLTANLTRVFASAGVILDRHYIVAGQRATIIPRSM